MNELCNVRIKEMAKKDRAFVTLSIKKADHETLKFIAIELGVSMSALIRNWIQESTVRLFAQRSGVRAFLKQQKRKGVEKNGR